MMKTEWVDEASSIGILYDDHKAKLVVDLIIRKVYEGIDAYSLAKKDGVEFSIKRKLDPTIWFK